MIQNQNPMPEDDTISTSRDEETSTLPVRTDYPADAGLAPEQLMMEGVRRAEAILFAAGRPLSAEQIAEVLPQGIEPAEVLMQLRQIYARRGVQLAEVDGRWRFQTAPDLSFLFVEQRQVQRRLSQAALETLAIIAYGQPVTRAEIEAVRGVAVSKQTLDMLMETGWIKIRGRRKTPGLPITYGTTPAFLEHFGLESLDTLPGKADLEAEGLLSDVLPPNWQMPDEETLTDEDGAYIDSEEAALEGSFITDFGSSEADTSESDEETGESIAFVSPQPERRTRTLDALEFETEVVSTEGQLQAEDQTDSDFIDAQPASGFSVAAPESDDHDPKAMRDALASLSRRLNAIDKPFGGWDDES
jgi:segregation and condensation protein B